MEDFVPYELAVQLNEVGFNYDTKEVYEINVLLERYFEIPKPTISQVLKWLRDKGIFIPIYYDFKFKIWLCGVLIMENGEFELKDEKTYKTYELAALAGIEYVINKLI